MLEQLQIEICLPTYFVCIHKYSFCSFWSYSGKIHEIPQRQRDVTFCNRKVYFTSHDMFVLLYVRFVRYLYETFRWDAFLRSITSQGSAFDDHAIFKPIFNSEMWDNSQIRMYLHTRNWNIHISYTIANYNSV